MNSIIKNSVQSLESNNEIRSIVSQIFNSKHVQRINERFIPSNNDYLRTEIEFFYYVLYSTFKSGKPIVPIPHSFRKKHFNKLSVKQSNLFKSKIVSPIWVNDHDGRAKIKEKSYEFMINPKYLNTVLKTVFREAIVKRNVSQKPLNHIKYDSNNNRLPDIVIQSYQNLDRCILNDDHLNGLKKYLYEKLSAGKLSRSDQKLIPFFDHINRQCYQPGKGYKLAYKPSSTGRIFEQGGIQNLSKKWKTKLFDINGVNNYDLESSQISVLVTLMENNQLQCAHFKDFITNENSKIKYSKEIGIEVKDFKTILFGKLFSGHSGDIGFHPDNSSFFNLIYRIAKRKVGKHSDTHKIIEEGKDITKKINAVFKPFNDELKTWNSYLKEEYKHRKRIKNDCGMNLLLQGLKGRTWVSKVSPFIIQGFESRFIHELTIKSSENGFQVLSNEHDGVVTKGEIPLTLIEQIKSSTGFSYAKLIKKPFL